LAGTPLREQVARYGPFVLNTQQEIAQAFHDYRSGRMGEIVRTARVG
jgi:redox-sensitive bicupin YhaK (pirin superfamily)